MKRIDRSLPIATYIQIARDLQLRISSGVWDVKKKIPSETQLAKDYGVSRMTVRQALAELDKEGIVARVQGVGTFIREGGAAPTRLTMSMSSTMLLMKALKSMGYEPEPRLTQSSVIQVPSGEIAKVLGISEGEQVAFFERSFVVDGRVLVVSRSFLPHKLCKGIADHPLEEDSIHTTLATKYGIVVRRAERWIESVRATDDEVATLGVETGSPQLLLTSLFFDSFSQPIEYVSTIWPGDTIRIHLEQMIDFA